MMRDVIERQAAIDALNSLQKFSLIDSNECLHGVGVRLKFAVQMLEQLPSAQPEEVVPHNYLGVRKFHSDFWCTCGWYLGKKGVVRYCPNCGKKVKWKNG